MLERKTKRCSCHSLSEPFYSPLESFLFTFGINDYKITRLKSGGLLTRQCMRFNTREYPLVVYYSVDLLLHHVIIDECWHEGDGESTGTFSKDLSNSLVLQPNHILPIHLSQVMINQNTIPTQTQRNRIHDLDCLSHADIMCNKWN